MKTDTLVAFLNELAIGNDGWAQIAPFGDFPGMALVADGKGGFTRERAIQRMDREAVTQMVNEYAKSRKGVRGFLKSRPLYIGHPDVPGCESKYPDKAPRGIFSNLACREDGFYGQLNLTEEGEALIANKTYRALSGRWEAEYVGEENGVKIYRPTKFYSAGLTNNPNLPVQLMNESEQAKQENTMKTKIIALLKKHGITLANGVTIANDASDAQIEEGLTQLGTHLERTATLANEKTTLANDKTSLATQLSAKEGEITTLKASVSTLTTERESARTAFANERAARIATLLDQAMTDGRITKAERPDWERRLGNEATFANEADALGKLGAKTKTESLTFQRGDRKVELSNASERRELVAELVSAEMKTSDCTYDDAFARVQKSYPQLFQAMKQPGK
jgi:phage I-like protein